ncbi:PrsW family glutamic-type intramembrane protease [Cytophagaceae bacterium ABcell3]|nr:PrsW family glutamic-type intramembrane protease [Cytophagaceae bacterium ABcell3]
MKKHLLLFSFLILAIVLLRLIFNAPEKEKYVDEVLPASFAIVKLDDDYQIVDDTLDFDFQYPQIEKFVHTPLRQMSMEGEVVRKHESFLKYYQSYLHSENPNAREIGFLALGMYYSVLGEGEVSLEYFNRLEGFYDHDLVVYWRGRSLALEGAYLDASLLIEESLERQIYEDSCKKYLIVASLASEDWGAAYNLIQNYPETKQYLSEGEYLKLLKANVSSLEFFVEKVGIDVFKFPFYASLFVAIIWFFLLISLNIFEARIFPAVFATLALSALSTLFLTEFLYKFYGISLLQVSPSDYFVYYVMVVGVVEELVKGIPFIVCYLIFRPKDSVAILLMAGMSGLAFSFIENITYLDKYGHNIVSVRGFSPTIVHVVLTSFLAYAVIYNRFYKKKLVGLYLLMAFAASAFLHGVYDYFLEIDDGVRDTSSLSIVLVLVLIFIYGMILGNSLNVSSNFYYDKSLRLKNRVWRFLAGLFAIEMFEYASVLYYSGVQSSDLWLIVNFFKVIFVVFLISHIITYKDLIKGRWHIFNLCPFYNRTHLNKLMTMSGKLVVSDQEHVFKPVARVVDRAYNSAYIALAGLDIPKFVGKTPVLYFFSSGIQKAKLGYFNEKGDFIKYKEVKIKLDEQDCYKKSRQKEEGSQA